MKYGPFAEHDYKSLRAFSDEFPLEALKKVEKKGQKKDKGEKIDDTFENVLGQDVLKHIENKTMLYKSKANPTIFRR